MSDARDTLDREQRDTVDILRARLSRYEAAIREALRLLGAPMFPSVGGNDVRDILRATLSDQPAESKLEMSFEKALNLASRDERFMATVYAMNTLLIHHGVYAHAEFENLFVEWFKKRRK